MRVPRSSWPLRSIIAGAAGTAAMTFAYEAERRLRPRVEEPLDYDDSLVPGEIVANIVHLPTLTGHAATTGEERELGVLLRWGYGSAFGLWHGALRRTIGEPWASAVFGATLMSATLSLFPLLGRTPPPWRWRTDQLLTSFGTHAVYVTTIALVDAALSLHDRDRGTVSRPTATLRGRVIRSR